MKMSNYLARIGNNKKYMNILYMIGSVVIIAGALFKFNHWYGVVPILIAGMTIATIILILSAFKK